ncbi:hypothetical protein V6Z12_D13G278200 [Gossypium hirsutum]
MNKPWFEKTFNGVNDDLFDDDVIKYLGLPLDDVERIDGGAVVIGGEEWDCNFQHLAGFCGGDFLDDIIVESLTFSCDGYSQQSSSTKASYSKSTDVKGSSWFQTSSPVSVLDSRSSSSGANRIPINPNLSFQGKRCRTNRRRASTLNSPFTLPLVFSTFITSQKPTRKRQKKKNPKLLSGSSESNNSSSQQLVIRKCPHCEVMETPQWREGPIGPKTLCNACGVRYRSDRLFPEYRPAGSPTFIPSLHSNSHKVVEMRRKSQFAGDSNNIRVVNPTETSLRYQLY